MTLTFEDRFVVSQPPNGDGVSKLPPEFCAVEIIVVVGYKKEKVMSYYGDEVQGVPITTHTSASRRGWRTRC